MNFSKVQRQQLDQWKKASIQIAEIQNYKEEEKVEEKITDQPKTTAHILITFSIFLIVLFAILYGFYWLISKFEFIKFIFFTTGVISFLYIISKK